jgi:hypothetical protein
MRYVPPYTPEYKAEIVGLITSGEKNIYTLAGDPKYPNIHALRRWLKEHKATTHPPNEKRETPHSPLPISRRTTNIQTQESVGKRIAVIPDMQVKPDVDLSYCARIGRYLADKKPDIIVNGGDFADMPSLNNYDLPGSKGMEGQRYKEDILSVQTAMRMMMTPIREEMERTGWNPRLVLTLGNHEDRINRAVKSTPKLEGVIGLCDLHYEEWGWEVIPFLQPITISGVSFAHYFCSGVMGRPITSARALLTKKHMSCFAFHQQGRDIAFGTRGDGTQMIAVIAGSCYEHDEHYLNPQTNNHWRGLYVLNDVIDGAFEENAVSLKYLRRKYGDL